MLALKTQTVGYTAADLRFLSRVLLLPSNHIEYLLGLQSPERIPHEVSNLLKMPEFVNLKATSNRDMGRLQGRLRDLAVIDGVVCRRETSLPLLPVELHALAVSLAGIEVYLGQTRQLKSVSAESILAHLSIRCASGGKGNPFGSISKKYIEELLNESESCGLSKIGALLSVAHLSQNPVLSISTALLPVRPVEANPDVIILYEPAKLTPNSILQLYLLNHWHSPPRCAHCRGLSRRCSALRGIRLCPVPNFACVSVVEGV